MSNQNINSDAFLNDFSAFSEKYPLKKDFYNRIDDMCAGSLQEIACQKDWVYLRKISTILHIIMSIISHPHITNKREEIVTRIEQARQLSNEDFTRVLRDGSLWKRHEIKMVPENVYYYQHVDELVIYENQFICLVIDLLDRELLSCGNFYLKMLPSLKNGIMPTLPAEKPQRIIRYIDLMRRRINYLKNTYFYRLISQTKPISRNIQRTNILLKDNLYSRCYRFYREYLNTEEKIFTYPTLRDFFLVNILQDLSSRGFKMLGGEGDIYSDYELQNDSFALKLSPYNNDRGFVIEVTEKSSGITAKHLMLLSLSTSFTDIERAQTGYDTVEALSLWGRIFADEKADDYSQIFTEKVLIAKYFDEKLATTVSDSDIYVRYCPVCRSKHPTEAEGYYICRTCTSRYVLNKHDDANHTVWFLRLRRANDGRN